MSDDIQIQSGQYILRDPVTGNLQSVPEEGSDKFAADNHLDYATPNQITEFNHQQKVDEHKGLGEQALGQAERVTRAATLGHVSGLSGTTEDQRLRAQATDEEHPYISGAATAIPAVAAEAAAAYATGGFSLLGSAAAGGYGSMGAAQDQAFKNDQELTTEQLASTGLEGALFGAALHGAGSLVSKGIGGAKNLLVERAAGAERGAAKEIFQKAGLESAGAEADRVVAKAADNPVEAASARKAADEARPSFQEAHQQGLSDLDTAANSVRQSSSSSALDAAFPAEGQVVRQAPALRSILHGLQDSLPADSTALRATIQSFKDDASQLTSSQAIRNFASDTETKIGSLLQDARDPTIAKSLQSAERDLKDFRANDALFGQQAANSAASMTAKQEAVTNARQNLSNLLDNTDYSAVAGTLKGKDIRLTADAYGQAIKDLEPTLGKEVDSALSKFKGGESAQTVATGNQVDALFGKTSSLSSQSTTGASLAKGALGLAADLGLYHALGPAAPLLRNAFKYGKYILPISGEARAAAESAASALVSGAVGAAKKAAPIAIGVGKGAVQNYIGTSQDHYDKVRGNIQSIAANPNVIAEYLANQLGDIPQDHPELHMQIAQKMTAAVEFLQTKLPPAFEYSLTNPNGPRASRTDKLQLALYVRGITKPKDVLKAIGTGSAMPEEIEAFKAVYPAWYNELQSNTIQKVQDQTKAGKPTGGRKLAQLSSLLDLSGELDPVFSPFVTGLAQSAPNPSDGSTKSPSYIPPPKAGQRTSPEFTGKA